jgi:hypothetical protein
MEDPLEWFLGREQDTFSRSWSLDLLTPLEVDSAPTPDAPFLPSGPAAPFFLGAGAGKGFANSRNFCC